MNSLDETEFCMIFKNEEIREYLIKPLKEYPDINFRVMTPDSTEISENSEEEIGFVCFDGERENFYIRFDGDQTSIFISDEFSSKPNKYTFNEEFMFIDEINKKYYTSSDTTGNVVYEGRLRERPHKEILELFREFIVLLIGAKKILIEENIVSQEGFEYPKCEYTVNIFNDSGTKKRVKCDNIVFSVNESY